MQVAGQGESRFLQKLLADSAIAGNLFRPAMQSQFTAIGAFVNPIGTRSSSSEPRLTCPRFLRSLD